MIIDPPTEHSNANLVVRAIVWGDSVYAPCEVTTEYYLEQDFASLFTYTYIVDDVTLLVRTNVYRHMVVKYVRQKL